MHRRRSLWPGNHLHVRRPECSCSSTLIYRSLIKISVFLQNEAYKRTFGHPGSGAQGAIVAAMPAGSFFGALLATKLADVLGRRPTIMISAVIWVIGSILQCASQGRGMLVVGRIISGISVGLVSSCVPLYQSEITNHNIRGRMVSLQQWAITW
jgi:MFS family permease